ncbi:hypothetical protein DSM19430T_29860 [Desulfovibrio psychrotolerans]|uniref:Uncharacterized protein n=1 Tax=Desulfovibrio psychrotolerans TaxID=415242 RepID=A0A7J0BYQ6_9BACT|nr:hypothetical protein DSM19430T_29860 [Desulfovibrio psychrotolerans]
MIKKINKTKNKYSLLISLLLSLALAIYLYIEKETPLLNITGTSIATLISIAFDYLITNTITKSSQKIHFTIIILAIAGPVYFSYGFSPSELKTGLLVAALFIALKSIYKLIHPTQ